MKTILNGFLIIAFYLVAANGLAAVITVNCNQGGSLVNALIAALPGDRIEVVGTCNESVTISTDGITLDGAGDATIDGGGATALTVDGVQRVIINGITVRNGLMGVFGRGGASFSLSNIVVKDSAVAGIQLEGNSSLEIFDVVSKDNGVFGLNIERASELKGTGKLTVRDNGVFGIFMANNASAVFSNADVTVKNNVLGIQVGINSSFMVADAATTVIAKDNVSTGLTVVSGSTLFVFEGAIVTRNNQFNHGVSANSNSNIDLDRGGSITTRDNGQDGIQLENSLLNMFNMPGFPASTVISRDNGRHGLSAFVESVIDLSGDSVITSRDNGVNGVLVDNGSTARIINSKIKNNTAADLELSFGARGDLNNNITLGNVVCDASVLIRGDSGIACPNP